MTEAVRAHDLGAAHPALPFLHGTVYTRPPDRARGPVEEDAVPYRKQSPRRGTRQPPPPWDADAVRALRAHLGATQGELAGELGVRQQTVSEWETGSYRPRGASVRLLSMVAEQAEFAYRAESSVPAPPPEDAPPGEGAPSDKGGGDAPR